MEVKDIEIFIRWNLDKSINLVFWHLKEKKLRLLVKCDSDIHHSNRQKTTPRSEGQFFLSSGAWFTCFFFTPSIKKLNSVRGSLSCQCHVVMLSGGRSLIRKFIDPDQSVQQCRLLVMIDSFNYRFSNLMCNNFFFSDLY